MTQPRQDPLILNMPFEEALERFARVNPRDPDEEPQPKPGRVTPFVKWAGGKRRVVDALVARFPPAFNRYWEPFVGGGALFFGVHERLTGAVLSDSNLDLVLAYNVVKADTTALIRRLEAPFARGVGGFPYYISNKRSWRVVHVRRYEQ